LNHAHINADKAALDTTSAVVAELRLLQRPTLIYDEHCWGGNLDRQAAHAICGMQLTTDKAPKLINAALNCQRICCYKPYSPTYMSATARHCTTETPMKHTPSLEALRSSGTCIHGHW